MQRGERNLLAVAVRIMTAGAGVESQRGDTFVHYALRSPSAVGFDLAVRADQISLSDAATFSIRVHAGWTMTPTQPDLFVETTGKPSAAFVGFLMRSMAVPIFIVHTY